MISNIIPTNATSANDGSIYYDLAVAGKYVYALSPGSVPNTGAELAVLSLEKGQNKSIIQLFNVRSWAGSSAQGLGFFSSFEKYNGSDNDL